MILSVPLAVAWLARRRANPDMAPIVLRKPFSVVPIEALMDARLTFRDLRVLIALLSFRDDSAAIVWPTRRALSVRCGLPETRISVVTTRLASLGWLVKDGCGGKSQATRYEVTIPAHLIALADSTVRNGASQQPQSCETVTETVTVTESVTVTDSVTPPVTKSVTPPVTKSVTRKEDTKRRNQGRNQRSRAIASGAASSSSSAVSEVFTHWQHVMQKPTSMLDAKRRSAIASRLQEGFGVDDLKLAIDGCRASDWHQGANDRKTAYNDIELICRNASKVESFQAIARAKRADQAELDAWVNEGNVIEGVFRRV